MNYVHTILGDTPYRSVVKFGYNSDVDTGAVEDVWDGGGEYPFPSAAAATTVVSTDAADTALGTGARSVTVYGLDANWAEVVETVALDGVTPVALTTEFLRVSRATVDTAGSGGVNAGAVSVKHGATTIASILAGNGQTLMAIYSTPAHGRFYRARVWVDVGKSLTSIAAIRLQFRVNGGAWQTKLATTVDNSRGIDVVYPVLEAVPPQCDIRLRVDSVSANNTIVAGGFDLYRVL